MFSKDIDILKTDVDTNIQPIDKLPSQILYDNHVSLKRLDTFLLI